MAPTPETQRALQDALQELFNVLNRAFWVASTIEAKDIIRGVSEGVFDVLTELNRGEIRERTAEYEVVRTSIDRVNKRLDAVKRDIDKLIHQIQVAEEVVGAIERAIAAAAKFLV